MGWIAAWTTNVWNFGAGGEYSSDYNGYLTFPIVCGLVVIGLFYKNVVLVGEAAAWLRRDLSRPNDVEMAGRAITVGGAVGSASNTASVGLGGALPPDDCCGNCCTLCSTSKRCFELHWGCGAC